MLASPLPVKHRWYREAPLSKHSKVLFAAHINEVKASGHLMNSKQASGGDYAVSEALSSVKELRLGYLFNSIRISSVQKTTIS